MQFLVVKNMLNEQEKKSRHLNYQLYIREVVQMTAFFPVVSITCLKIVCFVEKSVAGKPNFNKSFVLNSKCLNESLALKLNFLKKSLIGKPNCANKNLFSNSKSLNKSLALQPNFERSLAVVWFTLNGSFSFKNRSTSYKKLLSKTLFSKCLNESLALGLNF